MKNKIIYYGKITGVGSSDGFTIPKLIVETHKLKRGDTLKVVIERVGEK